MYEELDKRYEYENQRRGYPMWCEDCKEIVDATFYFDRSTGYREWQCPCGEEHTVVDIKYCKCGEPMGETDDLCPACKYNISEAWSKFLKEIDSNLDMYDVMNYIEEINK